LHQWLAVSNVARDVGAGATNAARAGSNRVPKSAVRVLPNVACERLRSSCAPEIKHIGTCLISLGHPWLDRRLLK